MGVATERRLKHVKSKQTKVKHTKKTSLTDSLLEANKKYQGSTALLGKTALTFPSYNDAMRTNMFTTHLNQFLNLLNPDFPMVFTNVENIVGKNSTGYKKAKHDFTVYKKVSKYGDIVKNPHIYYLFIFDKKKKRFDVIKRKPIEENLTENFAYEYDNSFIDNLKEGDSVDEGEVLYKSSSYDEHMDYCFGKNVTTMYSNSSKTYEDSAFISERLRDQIISVEGEKIFIGLNDNDYLLNLYGEKGEITDSKNPDEYYRPLPDIGTVVDGNLIATRRLFKNQILYDFKQESLNEIHDGDDVYYVNEGTEVIDYTFYVNNEDIKENMFNHQLNQYIRSQNKFYRELRKICEEIMASGYKYTNNIIYLYKRSIEMIENKKKWKEGDSAFSNMVIEVTIRKYSGLNIGQKISGRYGNKSVISEIVPNEEMPVAKDGRQVDLILNLCAIVNRTTAFPLYEITLSSMTYKIRQKMKEVKTLKEKELLYFRVLKIFNMKQFKKFKSIYDNLDMEGKKEFMDSVIENGIYLHQPPLWEEEAIFYRIQKLRKAFPWAVDDEYYVRLKNGELVRALNKAEIGLMYILKLKQTDRRGFSARNTGAINNKGLPTRSYKSRSHLERNSETPIRFGEYEMLNFTVGLSTEDIAAFNALYRTSPKARKDLVKSFFKNPTDVSYIETIREVYTNRVNEIFDVILKSLSMELRFVDNNNVIRPMNTKRFYIHSFKGKGLLCSDYQYEMVKLVSEIREMYMQEKGMVVKNELDSYIEDSIGDMNVLLDSYDSVKDLLGDELYEIALHA